MLTLNLKRVFAMRDIANPRSFLVKNGFTRPTAWNLLNNNTTQIKTRHLEKLCELLNGTPDDLYEWKPDKGAKATAAHPLRALLRTDKPPRYKDIISQMPLNKIDKMEEVLAQLRSAE